MAEESDRVEAAILQGALDVHHGETHANTVQQLALMAENRDIAMVLWSGNGLYLFCSQLRDLVERCKTNGN